MIRPPPFALCSSFIALIVLLTAASASGQGDACMMDTECPSDEFCNLRDEPPTCAVVPDDWCETNDDCPTGICDRLSRGLDTPRFGACHAEWIACDDDADCSAGQECAPDERRNATLGPVCQSQRTACDDSDACADRFECLQDGPRAGQCFPTFDECSTNVDCGPGWACFKFDDDGDDDEVVAPDDWMLDDSVNSCVPVDWASQWWAAGALDDESEDDREDTPDSDDAVMTTGSTTEGSDADSDGAGASAQGVTTGSGTQTSVSTEDAAADGSKPSSSDGGCSLVPDGRKPVGGAGLLVFVLAALGLRRHRD